jgi:hypothetical protein
MRKTYAGAFATIRKATSEVAFLPYSQSAGRVLKRVVNEASRASTVSLSPSLKTRLKAGEEIRPSVRPARSTTNSQPASMAPKPPIQPHFFASHRPLSNSRAQKCA